MSLAGYVHFRVVNRARDCLRSAIPARVYALSGGALFTVPFRDISSCIRALRRCTVCRVGFTLRTQRSVVPGYLVVSVGMACRIAMLLVLVGSPRSLRSRQVIMRSLRALDTHTGDDDTPRQPRADCTLDCITVVLMIILLRAFAGLPVSRGSRRADANTAYEQKAEASFSEKELQLWLWLWLITRLTFRSVADHEAELAEEG